jgi:hypothetical protein
MPEPRNPESPAPKNAALDELLEFAERCRALISDVLDIMAADGIHALFGDHDCADAETYTREMQLMWPRGARVESVPVRVFSQVTILLPFSRALDLAL